MGCYLSATPLVSGLEVSAGWGFLNTEFRNGTDAFTDAVLEGNRTPFTLNLTDNVAAQYRSENSFFGRLEVIEFGNTFLNDLNTVEREAFALAHLRLGYEYEDYGFSAFVNNLFDTEYATQIFELSTGTVGTFGALRTFGVQVRAKF